MNKRKRELNVNYSSLTNLVRVKADEKVEKLKESKN